MTPEERARHPDVAELIDWCDGILDTSDKPAPRTRVDVAVNQVWEGLIEPVSKIRSALEAMCARTHAAEGKAAASNRAAINEAYEKSADCARRIGEIHGDGYKAEGPKEAVTAAHNAGFLAAQAILALKEQDTP